jgi:hypothetical protein
VSDDRISAEHLGDARFSGDQIGDAHALNNSVATTVSATSGSALAALIPPPIHPLLGGARRQGPHQRYSIGSDIASEAI